MGRITVVDHDNMEVSNLHRQVVLTKGRRGTIKARSTRNAMRALKPTISVMAVMDTLTWENTIELLNVNNCVVDAINNPHTQYLINNVYVLVERETESAAMTNGISRMGGVPILMVSVSTMGI